MKAQLSGIAAIAAAATLSTGHAEQAVEKIERIEITGSRLTTSSDVESPSPIAIVNAKDIKLEGYQSLELILNNFPQFVPDQGNRISAGATGTATVNLRGLGPGRTLVLVNGKRMPAGSPFLLSPDLNQIPPQLIQRVEVLTGGASAVYGADAIAGVVNFIMNDRFEGAQGNISYDFYNHQQGNGLLQTMLQERGQPIPGDKWMDGKSATVDLTLGGNFAQNRGNVVASFRYFKSDALLQSQRDYSACLVHFPALSGIPVSDPTMPHCFGLGARYLVWDLDGYPVSFSPLPLTRDEIGRIRPYTYGEAFNGSPTTYYQRPQERYGFNALARYDVSPKAKVYAEFGYHDDDSVAQIDPAFPQHFGFVRYENPFLTDDWRSALVFRNPDGTRGTGSGTTALVLIGSRNHDGGPRRNELGHESFREVLGLKGRAGNLDYDAYFQDARVKYREQYVNDFSISRMERALDVVADPVTGTPVCRSVLDGSDRNCVPFNVWNGTASPAAVAYVQVSPRQRATISQRILGGNLTANLADYGVGLPGTRDDVQIAAGFERRTEELRFEAEDFADLESFRAAPPVPNNGGFTVTDWFMELRLPLLDLVNLAGSARHSIYDLGFTANTFGLGFNTAPFKSTRLRGSYQRAIRAPNLIELFQPQGLGVYQIPNGDPCSGETPAASLSDCGRTGVTPSQYGRILQSPAFNRATVGGNPQLGTETAKTYTAGIVFAPGSGLSATVDYYDVRIDSTISSIGGDVIFNRCIETGDPDFCRLIRRDPATGTLWLGEANTIAINQNIGKTRTAGVDVAVNYRLPVQQGGNVQVDGLGSYLAVSTTEAYKGAPTQSCAGTFHSACSDMPLPHWRHRLRLTWQPPRTFELAATWRYIGATTLFPTAMSLGPTVPGVSVTTKLAPMNYLDLAGSWTINKSVTVRGGINNVTDRDPPLAIGSVLVNGNTYAQLYDALGRHFFVSVAARF